MDCLNLVFLLHCRTAHGYSLDSADGAGEQGQVPVAGGHGVHIVFADGVYLRDGVAPDRTLGVGEA